jgi:hypothetical protein
MTSLYQDLQAEVGSLLAELGQPLTVNRYTWQNDLVEGTSAEALSQTQELSAAILPVHDTAAHLKDLDLSFMDGAKDVKLTRFALVSAAGALFEPGPKDRAVQAGGQQWRVLGCTSINPDGATDVVYIIGLQRI